MTIRQPPEDAIGRLVRGRQEQQAAIATLERHCEEEPWKVNAALTAGMGGHKDISYLPRYPAHRTSTS
jgi:hypothetical protein